ncbi:MAG: hypothetical protein JWL90_931 [Chthoniobacteraceae bacterium]|nr:hypothetical protein [Chthoniobacteraceae bacterium]
MSNSLVPQVDAQHPWIGLASFTEAEWEFFAGRSEECEELLHLVQRDTLTLLYGISGLGKTSLLNAGLFPQLRQHAFLPVPLRIDFGTDADSLSDQVHIAISKAASAAGVEMPEARPQETLWEYFHRLGNDFWSPRNKPVTPVLVFDQFEELFTIGSEALGGVSCLESWVAELADLIENRAPPELRSEPARAADFRFEAVRLRILFSLREDYLPELDRLRSCFRALGQNRLRLLPMSKRQARGVIELGAELFESTAKERVLTFLAGAGDAEEEEEATIAPALLSLVLQDLNKRRLARDPEAKITADLLDLGQTQTLKDFYDHSLEKLPAEIRVFIEDRLLTTSGYRNTCALDDALACQGVNQAILNQLVDCRLLAFEDRRHQRSIELTHDILVPVIKASRDSRHECEARERTQAMEQVATQARLRRSRRNFVICAVAGMGAVVVAAFTAVSQHRVTVERQAAEALVQFINQNLYGKLEAIGRRDLLHEVIKEIRKHYENLAVKSSAGSVLHVLRMLHSTINLEGDILESQGNLEKALGCYNDGLAVAQSEEQQIGGKWSSKEDLAKSKMKIGKVYFEQGALDIAEKVYLEAVDLGEASVRSPTDVNSESWLVLGECYEALGRISRENKQLDTSLGRLERSLAALGAAKPSVRQQHLLVRSRISLNYTYRQQFKKIDDPAAIDKAIAECKLAVESCKAQEATFPDLQCDLAESYDALGDALLSRDKKDLPEIRTTYEQGLKISKQLVQRDRSNLFWQRMLSYMCFDMGELSGLEGKWHEAMQYYQDCLDIRVQVVQQAGQLASSQQELATVCLEVAKKQKSSDRDPKPVLRQGLAAIATLERNNPLIPSQENLKSRLSKALREAESSELPAAPPVTLPEPTL